MAKNFLEAIREQPADEGNIPLVPPSVPRPSLYLTPPLNREDTFTFAQETYGAPEGWDYRTAETDWDGNPLPEGAISFDAHGEAYYGEGLQGWWKEMTSKFAAPVEAQRPLNELVEEVGVNESSGLLPPGIFALFTQEGREQVGQGLELAKGILKNLRNVGAEEGEEPTALTKVSRGLSLGVEAVLDAFQAASIVTKRQVGGYALGIEAAAEGSPLPELPNFTKRMEENEWQDALEIISSMTFEPIWNTVRTFAAPDGRKDRFEQAFEAGRLAYTAMMDATVKAEYIRRVEDGEDPGLLAIELQNPIAEAFGEIVFDPLNIVAWWAKGARTTKLAALVDEQSDLGRAFRLVDEAQQLGDAEKLTDAHRTFIGAVQSRSAKIAAEGAEQVSRVERLAERSRLFARTTEAARALKGDSVGRIAANIFTATKNAPETAAETLLGLVKIASSDASEVQEGVHLLRAFRKGEAMNLLLSDQAIETGVILRRALENADGVVDAKKFVDELSNIDNVDDMIEFSNKKFGKAINQMLPTVAQKIEAGEDVGAATLAIHNLHNSLQEVVRPLNTFFASIYMGLSPGYAFRNMLTNNVHVFVDEGVEAYVSSRRIWTRGAMQENVSGWLGRLPESVRGFTQAAGVAGGRAREGLAKVFQPVLGFAEKLEADSALRVVNSTVNRVMRNAIDKGGALATDALRAAGVEDEGIEIIRQLMHQHKGNVDLVALEYGRLVGQGEVNLGKTLVWANQDDLNRLDDLGRGVMVNQLRQDLQNAENLDDAVAAIGKIREEFDKARDMVSRVHPYPSADDLGSTQYPDGEDMQLVREFEHQIGQDRANLISNQISYNNQAIDKYRRMRQETATAIASKIPDDALRQDVLNLQDLANDIIADFMPRAELDSLRTRVRALGNLSRPSSTPAAEFWGNLWRNNADILGDVPKEGVDFKTFRSALWDSYFAKREGAWQNYRDINAVVSESYLQHLDGMPGVADGMISGEMIDDARDTYSTALRWQNAEMKGQRAIHEGETLMPFLGDAPVSELDVMARGMESPRQLDNYQRLLDRLEEGVRANWGTVQPVSDHDLSDWKNVAATRMQETRLVAERVAAEARNFTLIDYRDRRNIDLATSYIFPFHYWYGRTYKNWMTRIVRNPNVIAGYAKYRDALAKEHAGMPDWWKYNINSNELLGLDSDNPLFFNLEATLNPLNGLTGVDFEDPYRRTTWYSSMVADLNRFGPSTWTPLNLATALALHIRGDEEAAQRVAGRLFPQSRAVRTLTSALGMDGPITGDPGVEIDPLVHLYGGLDPYQRRRVGRALGELVAEFPGNEAEIIESARTQSGEWWNEAIRKSFDSRAAGNISSLMFGVGFKARSVNDLRIDQFYNDYFRLMEGRDMFSPDEFRGKMNALEDKYEFMDTLLLSRKGGYERDVAYAYNVLSRIPPGSKTELAQQVGLPTELISQFWDSNGRIEEWSESDRNRFMAAMVDIGAVLDVPEEATRDEWTLASSRYSQMLEQAEGIWGSELQDRVDAFYALNGSSQEERDAANQYLQLHPDVEQFLDWRSMTIISDPILSAYYGGIEQINSFYKGTMYDIAQERFGRDIFDIQGTYFDLKETVSNNEARRYLREHPELKEYWDFKHEYEREVISPQVIGIAANLPEGIGPIMREVEALSLGQSQLQSALADIGPQGVPIETFVDVLGDETIGEIIEFLGTGQPLSQDAADSLQALSVQSGLPIEVILQEIVAGLQ